MQVITSPFKVKWTDKASVVAYARRLDAISVVPQIVYKRSDRPNYNITFKTNYNREFVYCLLHGIGFEVVWEGVGRK